MGNEFLSVGALNRHLNKFDRKIIINNQHNNREY